MNVLQVSAECYPAVKKGGLGDVVGSVNLPFLRSRYTGSV
jgi:glycogen synthase